MILTILEHAGQIACLICIFFSIRAANDAYKCYEKNSDFLAVGFLAFAYLLISSAYSAGSEKIDPSLEATFRLLHLSFVLITAKFCANKSEYLRRFCVINFKKA